MAEGTQVGTAYVEVTTKLDPGAKEKIRRQLPDESDGGKSGHGLAKGMKAGLQAGAVALGNIISDVAQNAASTLADTFAQAFNGYAEFEQLSGGVEKLFGPEAAEIVKKNADEAFRTAGMSANQYMEQATSFSAALIKSLNGDTVTAAQITDQAMRDMSDNVNVFGSDMKSVQNAYQGFAKGQFNMLDNLKLGYGGTKEEMQKLLRDAEQMEGFMEGSLSIDSFADILDAIHIIQEHQKIAGTTAKEAASTVEGSIGQMQAAWDNWLTALGREDVDMTTVTDNLIQSIETAAQNAIPVAGRIIESMGAALVTYGPVLFDNALVAMSQIAAAAPDATPQVIAALLSLIMQGAMALLQGAPQFLTNAIYMLGGIVQGIVYSIPGILSMIASMIPILVQQVAAGAGQMLGGAIQFFDGITKALVEVGGKLVEMVGYIITHLPEIIMNGAGAMADAGKAFLDGLVSGFLGGAPELDGAAAESARQMSETAAENADGSAVAESYNDTLMSSFDMSQFEAMASDNTQAAIDAAALSADAAPISDQLSTTAADSIDLSAMDPNATTMVENAVKAAQSVDSSSVGEQFSEQAAGGIDTQAMADKIASATAAASTDVKVGVQVDTSGIQKLTSMASGVASAYAAASSRASASVKAISTAAASSGAGFSTLSTKAVTARGQVSTKAATVKRAIDSIPSSKTITITTAKGHLWYPTYSMPAVKPGETKSASVSWNYMAEGGILTKPVFVAGEAGPEAVLPLSKLAGMLDDSNEKYGGDVVVNLNYDASADAEEMARDIARSLKRYRMAGAF